MDQVWDVLQQRGFLFDVSGIELLKEESKKPLAVYAGFDLTAESFHVGHLVPLMALRHLQRAGHKVVALLGGATTRIGDPSDKNAERPMLAEAVIEKNKACLRKAFQHFLCDGPLEIVDNSDWLSSVKYLEFLRDIGRHFSMNRMMKFEFIRRRLDANLPLSFLEVNYIALQSYDFLHLFDTFGCKVQLGGQDQWANIISGVELVRRVRDEKAFAVTCPLVTTSSGQKMGKTASGAVWLDAEKCSPYDFWQFWRNTTDADVGRFLKLFTFLDMDQVKRLESLEGQELNKAKEVLADQVTALLHGQEAAENACTQAQKLFAGQGGEAEQAFVVSDPSMELSQLLVDIGLVSSKSEARRLIRSKAVKLDGHVATDETANLETAMSAPPKSGQAIHLSVGKKKHKALQVS